MTPAAIDDMSWAMAEVYGAVTDRILINLARHFKYVQAKGEITGSFEYQAKMLAQMGQVNKETIAIMAQSLGGADEALKAALETAIFEALKTEEPKLRKAAEKGLLRVGVPELSPNQLQAFRAYYRQSADKLNLVNTVMLESTQSAYMATVSDVVQKINRSQSILNTATGEVVTGVSSWNQALHGAVQKMVSNGLTGFIDHGGHKWSPEAYVAMDIRTTMFNTSRAAIWERSQQYGNDLYQVSSHQGARPLCYPWQGKVISTTGRTGTTEDLDGNTVVIHSEDEIESFRYGGGLFGVNCGHYPMVFIPGVSTLKGEPQDPEDNAKTYAESQQQRALERKLREEKRDLEVMKVQGASPQEIAAQRERVRNASADIDQFCQDTGRTRKRSREYTPINAEFPDVPPKHQVHLGDNDIPQRGQVQVLAQGAPPDMPDDVPDITPTTPSVPTEPPKPSYFHDFGEVQEITQEQAEVLNKRFKELDSKYHAEVSGVKTVLQRDQDEYDLLFNNRVQYEMEMNPRMRRTTAEKKVREMLGERPKYGDFRYIERGGDFNFETKLLTVNPHAPLPNNTIAEDIITQKKRNERNAIRAAEGRKILKTWNVGESIEGTLVHEYGHAIDATYNVAGSPIFRAFYSSLNEDVISSTISEYATTNEREFIAEAFAQSFMGDTQSDISRRFMEILGEIVR